MAVKISRGGRKAKAPNSAEKAFVPSGYLSLGDVVAAAGKAHFGNSWTGDEINYGFVDIESRKSDDYRQAIFERQDALFREEFGLDEDELLSGDLPTISDKDFRTIQRRVEKKWAAIKEARQRFDHAVGWVQDRLWSGVIPAVVLTTNGTINPIPRQLWGSDDAPPIFKTEKVEFHPAKYGRESSPTAALLRGRVLIKREHMDWALSGEETPPQETSEPGAADGDATKRGKKGGRPEKYDWDQFWIEVVRIANMPDGLPDKQGKLVRLMRDWCDRTWKEIPGETTVKDRIRRLYREAIRERTET